MLPRSREPGKDTEHHGRAGRAAWLIAAVALVLAANAMASRYLFSDTFYDLYAGRLIARHGVPRVNTITVTAHGSPWVDQQWLAQVLYYGTWCAGGYRLLALLSAVLVTSGFALLAVVMLRRGVPPTRVFAWTLATFLVCIGNTGIRAQSFAYPCFALTLWLLSEDDRGPRLRSRTWLVVPVLVVWANTHGSVLLGAAMAFLYGVYRAAQAALRREARQAGACVALAVAAPGSVVATPYGTSVLGYYHHFTGNPPLARYVSEWAPPSPLSRFSWGFFGLLIVMAVTLFRAWRRGARPDPLLCALTAGLLALALTAVRNQAWFAFGGTLLAADATARATGRAVPALSRQFGVAITSLLVALAAASLVTLVATPDSQFFTQVPRRAINVAADIAVRNPHVRILGDDYSGSAMLWLRPAVIGRVGFDARFELYGRHLGAFSDFLFARGAHWAQVTRGYGVVVASRRHPQLTRGLSALPGWRVAFEDGGGIVVVRH
jgi:hypothetical protein